MPYIGNNHIAGDHTNNFKVLDDISSFTATFDGSATSVVDTTNNTIRVVEHRFIQGQRVTYTNGGGGNIGGLTTGTADFVICESASTSKLAIPYGVCKLDSSTGTLKSMLEKPVLDYLVNTGFYVLSPKILKLIPNKMMYY